MILLVLYPVGGGGDSPWDWVPSLHGYKGADTQPGMVDERVAFCEEQSIQLAAAAGHVAFYDVVAERPSKREKERLFTVLQQGIERYPSGFLQEIGLQRVAFTKQAHTSTMNINGVAYRSGQVILDADAPLPLNTIHHEFFHLIEFSGKVTLGGWDALNPPDFVYQGDQWVESPVQNPCFVTRYATRLAMEDRAEVFAAMMGHRRFLDPCVQRKASVLAVALANRFPELSAAVAEYLPTSSEP